MIATLALMGWVQSHMAFTRVTTTNPDLVERIDVVNRVVTIQRRPGHMYPPMALTTHELRLVFDAIMTYESQ